MSDSKEIERSPVSSSTIKAVGYDKDAKTLAVEFSDGSVYHYDDVSSDAHQELIAAKSIGKHFHGNIKGAFKFKKQD